LLLQAKVAEHGFWKIQLVRSASVSLHTARRGQKALWIFMEDARWPAGYARSRLQQLAAVQGNLDARPPNSQTTCRRLQLRVTKTAQFLIAVSAIKISRILLRSPVFFFF